LSGYSKSKLKRIKNHWLEQLPKEQFDYPKHRYLICDATYFHKDGCFLNLMDAKDQKIIAHTYVAKESFKAAYPWFLCLKDQGLDPGFITMDGEKSVMRAARMIWPCATIQRCLYHIQREGMRWLRTHPKTQAGSELRALLSRLSAIKSFKDQDFFFDLYRKWLVTHKDFIWSLPNSTVAIKDLKRTTVLLKNALADMFHYLKDPNIHHTTNALEGFYSRLKSDYQRHRGLSKKHRLNYLSWYCYFKNQRNINNL